MVYRYCKVNIIRMRIISNNMKTVKEIYEFKKELIKTLETGDRPYYGLSLESLVSN